jgi:hypothetical protein
VFSILQEAPVYRPEQRVLTTMTPVSVSNKPVMKDIPDPLTAYQKTNNLPENDPNTGIDQNMASKYGRDDKQPSHVKEHNSVFQELIPNFKQQKPVFQDIDSSVGKRRGGQKQWFGKQNDAPQYNKPATPINFPRLSSERKFQDGNLGTGRRRPALQHQRLQSDQKFARPRWTGNGENVMQSGTLSRGTSQSTGFGGYSGRAAGPRTDSSYKTLQMSEKMYQGSNGGRLGGKSKLVRGNVFVADDSKIGAQTYGGSGNRNTNTDSDRAQYPDRLSMNAMPGREDAQYQKNALRSTDSRISQVRPLPRTAQRSRERNQWRTRNGPAAGTDAGQEATSGRLRANDRVYVKTDDQKGSARFEKESRLPLDTDNIPTQIKQPRVGTDSKSQNLTWLLREAGSRDNHPVNDDGIKAKSSETAQDTVAGIQRNHQTSTTNAKGTLLLHGSKHWISEHRTSDPPLNVLHEDASTYRFSTKTYV